MAREVVERAAGGHDVDEAEQRGLELGVLRGELHRLLVGGLERVARRRRERRPEPLADRVQLALQRGVVHARERYAPDRRGHRTRVAPPFDICSVCAVQELADALAERLGAPVAIEDRRYRMLAYSAHAEAPDRVRLASILTREAPADLAAWLDANGLPDAEAPVRLAPPPQLGMGPRVAVPIPGRLGYVWLVDDGRVGEEALAAAPRPRLPRRPRSARGARRSARSARSSARCWRGDHERRPAAARARPARAGARRRRPRPRAPPPRHRRARPRCSPARTRSSTRSGSPSAPARPRERLEEAPAALREAELAASLRGRGRVVRWEALGALQLLAPLAGAPGARARSRGCSRTRSCVATLEAYLDRAGDAQAAAAALFIHRTTLYHRLRRIERIAGVDLHDGDDRLLLHMALRLRALG